jgi:polyphosphate kinase 2 (PPK2 family)
MNRKRRAYVTLDDLDADRAERLGKLIIKAAREARRSRQHVVLIADPWAAIGKGGKIKKADDE